MEIGYTNSAIRIQKHIRGFLARKRLLASNITYYKQRMRKILLKFNDDYQISDMNLIVEETNWDTSYRQAPLPIDNISQAKESKASNNLSESDTQKSNPANDLNSITHDRQDASSSFAYGDLPRFASDRPENLTVIFFEVQKKQIVEAEEIFEEHPLNTDSFIIIVEDYISRKVLPLRQKVICSPFDIKLEEEIVLDVRFAKPCCDIAILRGIGASYRESWASRKSRTFGSVLDGANEKNGVEDKSRKAAQDEGEEEVNRKKVHGGGFEGKAKAELEDGDERRASVDRGEKESFEKGSSDSDSGSIEDEDLDKFIQVHQNSESVDNEPAEVKQENILIEKEFKNSENLKDEKTKPTEVNNGTGRLQNENKQDPNISTEKAQLSSSNYAQSNLKISQYESISIPNPKIDNSKRVKEDQDLNANPLISKQKSVKESKEEKIQESSNESIKVQKPASGKSHKSSKNDSRPESNKSSGHDKSQSDSLSYSKSLNKQIIKAELQEETTNKNDAENAKLPKDEPADESKSSIKSSKSSSRAIKSLKTHEEPHKHPEIPKVPTSKTNHPSESETSKEVSSSKPFNHFITDNPSAPRPILSNISSKTPTKHFQETPKTKQDTESNQKQSNRYNQNIDIQLMPFEFIFLQHLGPNTQEIEEPDPIPMPKQSKKAKGKFYPYEKWAQVLPNIKPPRPVFSSYKDYGFLSDHRNKKPKIQSKNNELRMASSASDQNIIKFRRSLPKFTSYKIPVVEPKEVPKVPKDPKEQKPNPVNLEINKNIRISKMKKGRINDLYKK